MSNGTSSTIPAAAASASANGCAPPRPPRAFRVGVVGHRPNRLQHADLPSLAHVLREILQAIKGQVEEIWTRHSGWYSDDPPVLRAVSPLAEGIDRLFAEQALNLSFELCCVMPFAQNEFEKDFAPDAALEPGSLSRFRSLLARAEGMGRLKRFELDGNREDAGSSYGSGGRVVLNQADVLVVVWDGEKQGKRGGTEETFDAALRSGVPVVWVDARAPHAWQLPDLANPLPVTPEGQRTVPDGSGTMDGLRKWVRGLLEPPAASTPEPLEPRPRKKIEDPQQSLKQFYSESQPTWKWAILWQCFRDVFGDGRFPKPALREEPFERAVKKGWPEDRSTPTARLVDSLRPYYAWPDKLAVIYSDRYRSAFILIFLLAALAVGMALLPVGCNLELHCGFETLCIAIELTAIVAILGLVYRGRRRRWHERWIDYRLAAELARHLRLVAPLGGARPFPQIPAHWATYGQPGASWMAWYVRAVERVLGLPSVLVNRVHLDACLSHLAALISEQIKYHETNARRCDRIDHRLHRSGIFLLALTLLACVVHLFPGLRPAAPFASWLPPHLLTFFCGFFPALGAALAGINNQGEFRRITKRSKAMQKHLEPLLIVAEKLRGQINDDSKPGPQQFSVLAGALSAGAARLLVNEVLDWRVVFLDRPLIPPS